MSEFTYGKGNSLDLITTDDIISTEGEEKFKFNNSEILLKSNKRKYYIKILYFIFLYCYAISCFIDLFLYISYLNKNNNITLFSLRLIIDILTILPTIIYVKNSNKGNINLTYFFIGIIMEVPKTIINLISCKMIYSLNHEEDNIKENEEILLLGLKISSLVNLIYGLFLSFIMFLKVFKK